MASVGAAVSNTAPNPLLPSIVGQGLSTLFSQAGGLENALSKLAIALSSIPLGDQSALLPALHQLKQRLFRNQSDHSQYIQWAFPTLAVHTIQLPIESAITDVVDLNLKSPVTQALTNMLIFCLEQDFDGSKAQQAFLTILAQFRINSGNSLVVQQLWMIPFVVFSLPHSMMLQLHTALISNFATYGNITLSALSKTTGQTSFEPSPFSQFLTQIFEKMAILFPDILMRKICEIVSVYKTDVLQASTLVDPTKASRHVMAYLVTVCILSPSTWKVCETQILKLVFYEELTRLVLMESTFGFSVFQAISSSTSDLLLNLFFHTLRDHRSTLKFLVGLCNWCTSIKDDIDAGADNSVRETANIDLLRDLELLFSNWYRMACDTWIFLPRSSPVNGSDASPIVTGDHSNPFYSSKECVAIMASMNIDRSLNARQGQLAVLVGLHMDMEQLSNFLSQEHFFWTFDDRVAFFFVQIYPDLPIHILSFALSSRCFLSVSTSTTETKSIIAALGNSLRNQDGMVLLRHLLTSLGHKSHFLAGNVKFADYQLPKGGVATNALNTSTDRSLGIYLHSNAMFFGTRYKLEPCHSFILGVDVFNQALPYYMNQQPLPVAEAHMAYAMDYFSSVSHIPTFFQRILRKAFHEKTALTRGMVSSSTKANHPSLKLTDMLMMCSLHTSSISALMDCMSYEIFRTRNDPLSLFSKYPWLWNLCGSLAKAANSEPGYRIVMLEHLSRSIVVALRRYWSLRPTQRTIDSPLQLNCTKRQLELLSCIYSNIITEATSVLWSCIWLMDHLNGEQTVNLLDIWMEIARAVTNSRQMDPLKDSRLPGWILQAAALWKSAVLFTDDEWLLAMASAVLRTSNSNTKHNIAR
ncbi:hypothetical protein BASA50_010868 [Batrachochytrium salamandrivorans]|uniref:Uncharacterized protein n=1 Tax=Batrachochytrium salamandrivorans TaxID=1357716 RepID=A0ABQ8EXR5_9FUNG|nr:hypothetical protein BASA60_006752 [Batrachochytrium salamandrivorans]KAH6575506.1 hypothetical protein BASA62_001876 [Batrachochytrium salamandrivorans]KAH6588187.1 hypothetical protein BASA50_010868 [Batrachochytrium salamandrivorans]KAH6600480.1 hypothetical protein BASA61_002272 [Batrachochytrium salamandrivorans]